MQNKLLHHYLLKARLQKEGEHDVGSGKRQMKIIATTFLLLVLAWTQAQAAEQALHTVLKNSTLVASGHFTSGVSGGVCEEIGAVHYSMLFRPDATFVGCAPTNFVSVRGVLQTNTISVAINHPYLEATDKLKLDRDTRYIVFLKPFPKAPHFQNADFSFWFLPWNSMVVQQINAWKTANKTNGH